MKILISAYAFKPESSSEPWVGWSIVNELSKTNYITVVTRQKNKKLIDTYIKKNDLNIKMIYFDLPLLFKIKKFLGNTVGTLLYYYLWQFFLIFKLKKIVIRYDYVHHLTYINSWMPSFIPLITNNFIWGPIAEHPSVRIKFLREMPRKYMIMDSSKALIKLCFSYLDPFYHYCVIKSKVIIVSNSKIAQKFDKYGSKVKNKIVLLSSIHYEENDYTGYKKEINELTNSNEISIVMAGRWAYWKGFHIAIDIFAYYCQNINKSAKFTIISEQISKNMLLEKIKKLKLEDNITFIESKNRIDFMNLLSTFDVFIYPNFGINPIILLDANYVKIPVICFDIEGTHELINDTFNIKVTTDSKYDMIIKDFALSIDKARSIKKNLICIKNELNIKNKINIINKIYEEIK